MRKSIAILSFYLLSLCSLHALTLGLSFDAGLLQDFAVKTSSYNTSVIFKADINSSFQARADLGFVKSTEAQMFEAGLFLTYYPFENYGFFTGLSLFQFGFIRPENILSKNNISLNEVILGWTVKMKGNFFIEPSISIRDPSGTFTDEYSNLKAAFPCYKNFRAHVYAGWNFNTEKLFRGVKK